MPTMKLTKAALATIGEVEKVTLFYDEDLTGFGLRVTPAGSRSWFVEYRPGAGGRGVSSKRITIGTIKTLSLEKARKEAQRTIAAATLGADPAKERAEEREGLTVKKLLADYIEQHVRPRRKESTAQFYEWVASRIEPHIGSKRALLVTREEVGRMHVAMSHGKGADRRGKFAANRALAVLSAAYNWGAKTARVPSGTNPAVGVEKFTEEGRDRFLTGPEIDRLHAALREAETIGLEWSAEEDRPAKKHSRKPENRRTVWHPSVVGAFRLLLLTGMRPSEVLGLRWEDVDADRGVLFLPDSKTGRKTVVLADAALAVLDALPRIGRYVIASDSAGTDKERPRSDLKRPWDALRRRAALGDVRLYDLRHTYASIGVASGQGLPIIGKMLGHSNTRTTQRYAHLDTDPVRQAANAIAERIGK